jgi:exonuclease VII small subunit
MLSCLETLERVMKYLEKGVELKKTSKDIQDKLEA